VYRYEGVNGTCRQNPRRRKFTISEYVNIAGGSDEELIAVLATVGPVAAAMNATPKTLQFYKSGVYCDPMCSPEDITHAVINSFNKFK
jgi:Papain family cysteine protease